MGYESYTENSPPAEATSYKTDLSKQLKHIFTAYANVTKRSPQVIMPLVTSLHQVTYMLHTQKPMMRKQKSSYCALKGYTTRSAFRRYSTVYFLFTLCSDTCIHCNGWLVGCCAVTIRSDRRTSFYVTLQALVWSESLS